MSFEGHYPTNREENNFGLLSQIIIVRGAPVT